MTVTEFHKRVTHRNPLEPYSWRAIYRNGDVLNQFGIDGYHYSKEIDKIKVAALVILGHPHSPIHMPAPEPWHIPDEVILKAQVQMRMKLGSSEMHPTLQYFFGFRYGTQKYLVRIDENGTPWKTDTEELPRERWTGGQF